jgi:hypothetical protein
MELLEKCLDPQLCFPVQPALASLCRETIQLPILGLDLDLDLDLDVEMDASSISIAHILFVCNGMTRKKRSKSRSRPKSKRHKTNYAQNMSFATETSYGPA